MTGLAVCALAVWLVGETAAAASDVFLFQLRNGGRIRGRWINCDERPLRQYIIEPEQGGQIVLVASQVTSAVRRAPAELEYERIAPDYAETIDDQWRLAQWCRAHRLKQQRAVHLRRILDMDPDHPGARRGLGYSQVRGQWVLRDEARRHEGYAYYRGRWRTAQEIQLLEERHKLQQFEKEWLGKLRRWRSDLATERAGQARRQILAIRDGYAVNPLAQLLKEERFRALKLVYVEALGNIGSPAAIASLIVTSLNDPDQEVFYACLDQIVAHKLPEIGEAYIQALKDENNARVNRAAIALARIQDRTAIPALIEALVTTHRVVIPGRRGASPDTVTATFSDPDQPGSELPGSFGGTGLSSGDGSQVILRPVPNQQVLTALVKLGNGPSFGFDARAWRNWYAGQTNRLAPLQGRRD